MKQTPATMKTIVASTLCFALVLSLATTITRAESCLPPSATAYKEINKSDAGVRDLAEFAAKEMDIKMISVTCAGKLKRPDGSYIYKLVIEIEDQLQNKRRTCEVEIFDSRQKNKRFIIVDTC